jgi:hypothetical protein
MELILIIALVFLGLFIYFLPSYIAEKRNVEDFNMILLLNILLGWTLLFYFVALIWAIVNKPKKKNR